MPRKRNSKACSVCGSKDHTRPRCPTIAANVPLSEDRAPPPLESPSDGPPQAAPGSAPDSPPADVGPKKATEESEGDSSGPTPEQQKEALQEVLQVAFGTWSQALVQAGAFGEPNAGLYKARQLIDMTAAKLCAEVAVQFGWLGDSKWMNLVGAAAVVGTSYGYPTVMVLQAKKAEAAKHAPGLAAAA